MSAEPARPVEVHRVTLPRDPVTGLQIVSRQVAQRHGLVSVYDLSQRYKAPTRNFKAGMTREGAPQPRALSEEYHYGRRSELYLLREFQEWHDRLPGEKPLGIARRTPAVRVVGTKTSGAGSRYVWRDPQRWEAQA